MDGLGEASTKMCIQVGRLNLNIKCRSEQSTTSLPRLPSQPSRTAYGVAIICARLLPRYCQLIRFYERGKRISLVLHYAAVFDRGIYVVKKSSLLLLDN